MQGQYAAKYVPLARATFMYLNNISFLYTDYSNTATEEKLREWTREAHLTFIWGGQISTGWRKQLYSSLILTRSLFSSVNTV
jgi:hypothetical protein